jgi:hypothetical protein
MVDVLGPVGHSICVPIFNVYKDMNFLSEKGNLDGADHHLTPLWIPIELNLLTGMQP